MDWRLLSPSSGATFIDGGSPLGRDTGEDPMTSRRLLRAMRQSMAVATFGLGMLIFTLFYGLIAACDRL